MNIRLILKRSAQLLLVPFVALMASCNEQDPDTISVGSVKNGKGETISVLNVTPEGTTLEGEKYIVYPSTDTWTVKSDSKWCVPQRDAHLNQSTNKDNSLELFIYAADDKDFGMTEAESNRVARVVFTYGDADYTLLVNQNNIANSITVLPASKVVSYEATTFEFVVISTSSFSVSSPVNWASCSVDPANSFMVSVDVEENDTELERNTEFTIYCTDGTQETFKLTQEGRNPSYVKADMTNYTFPATGAVAESIIVSHNLIEAPTFTVSSSLDWCTVSTGTYTAPTGDAENGTYEFEISTTDNTSTSARDEAVVTITATSGDITVSTEVKVNQAGLDEPSISIGESTYKYSSSSYTAEAISFTAVGDTFSAGANVSWITNVAATAEGITFDMDANTTGEERTATITISAERGGMTVTEDITIVQDGVALYLNTPEESIFVEAAGEAIEVPYATNGTVTFYSNATWCTGADGAYTISKNETGYARTTTIVVEAKLNEQVIVKTVQVEQACDVYEN